jgi:hypothetical protein
MPELIKLMHKKGTTCKLQQDILGDKRNVTIKFTCLMLFNFGKQLFKF